MSQFKRILVTAALPYANGPIHLGHLAGAYLPADIFVRYHRLKGNDVVYICGSDEHGVPIMLRARQENDGYQQQPSMRGQRTQQAEEAHAKEQGAEIAPNGVDADGAGGLCKKSYGNNLWQY